MLGIEKVVEAELHLADVQVDSVLGHLAADAQAAVVGQLDRADDLCVLGVG